MAFLDMLKKQGDKANLNDMIEVRAKLPERVTGAIPGCMYIDTGEVDAAGKPVITLDYEVFRVLAWGVARRQSSEITLEEVGERIGMCDDEAIRAITREIIYFYTTKSREDIEARFAEEEQADINPPVILEAPEAQESHS